jgi:hypothetical protein
MNTHPSIEYALVMEQAHGARVESVQQYSATITTGRPSCNHVMHALLSVMTLGLWLPIWFIVAVSTGHRQRWLITLDGSGTLHKRAIPSHTGYVHGATHA